MKITTTKCDGLMVSLVLGALRIVGCPLDILHEAIKKAFTHPFLKSTIWATWNRNDLEGLYIELWTLGWTLANTLFLLPRIAEDLSNFWYFWVLVMIIRAADMFRAFLGFNLGLTQYRQRSLARSYAMLWLVFFEMAAIFSSLHFVICREFSFCNETANWRNVYYYSLRNMVTIGGGDIIPSQDCLGSASFLFGVIRVAEPLFSILFVSLAASQILKKLSQQADEHGNAQRKPKKGVSSAQRPS